MRKTLRRINGEQSGIIRLYYENGTVERDWYATKGVTDGLSKEYDKGGRLINKSNFKNGLPHGESEVYRNGVIRYYFLFHHGKLIKKKIFNKDGHLEFESKI